MDKMNRMIEALKARAEKVQAIKSRTPEELRKQIENSPLMKRLKEGKAKFNIQAKEE